MSTLAFLDTETTSLDRYTRKAWDIAYILRDETGSDREVQFFVDVSLRDADPLSLAIGRYYDRHPNPYVSEENHDGPHNGFWPRSKPPILLTPEKAAVQVAQDLRGAILVGTVPSFDEETLARMLIAVDLQPTWDYHLIDIGSAAAGRWGLPPPWKFSAFLARAGLSYDDSVKHTALGDARMVRDLYDAIFHGVQ